MLPLVNVLNKQNYNSPL